MTVDKIFDRESQPNTSTQNNLINFPGTYTGTNDNPNSQYNLSHETIDTDSLKRTSMESVSRRRKFEEYFFDFMNKETYNDNKNSIDSNNSIGDDNMDKILEKYIDKMDRDQSDLRNDIRASEERTARTIELSEERNIARLAKIEEMISEHNERIDEKYDKLESKIDNNNKFIISITISVIIGIAAMVVTILLTLYNFVDVMKG